MPAGRIHGETDPVAVNTADTPPPTDELAAALAVASAPDVLPEAGLQAARLAAARAGELGRQTEQTLAEAWVCTHLARLGRLAEVLELGPRVLARLQEGHHGERQRELLRHLALAASELGLFGVALDAAQTLAAMAQASGAPDDALASSFLLAATLERMGDSWQALRLLGEALAAHDNQPPSHALLVACNAVCAICVGLAHRLRGTGDDEERAALLAHGRREGERALALLQQVRGDTYAVAIPANLGELQLMQGQPQAAGPLLESAMALAQARGLRAHVWRISTSQADALLAMGQPGLARDRMTALIAEMGEQAPQQTLIRAHDTAYRACRALGRSDEALHHLEQAERLDRKRSTGQLRSQSQLFVTRTEVDRAHADAARQSQRAAEFAADAERDALTGLGNRRHLERRVAELLPRALGEGTPLALAVLDIDHFKLVNDRHGHLIGDQVLVQLSQLLRENMRASDVLARYGGEEFVVVLPGMTLAAATEVCERLRECVHSASWPAQAPISISVGLAVPPPHDWVALLQQADKALYRAKAAGRNRVEVGSACPDPG